MEIDKLSALVCAVQQGDRHASNDLYAQTHQGLYYYISKTVNDPELAQDLLQETFIEIYQTIGNLKEPAAFLKWSRQIAYHKCTAYDRKTKAITVDENEDGLSIFDTIEEDRAEFIPDEALDKEDLKQTIHAMLAELPMEQRSAIMLRYFDEISVKEIAEIQGVSEGTVKSRLNYGRKALQKSVEDYEKRSGVKLHCAGVIPLLLWLFANEASATSAAASTASVATSAVAPVVAKGVKEGAKVAGKFTVKRIIAGIAAAVVAAGGIAAGVLLSKPQSTVAEPMEREWVGYGQVSNSSESRNRFQMSVDEMDDERIAGYWHVSYLFEPIHTALFEGIGTEKDGKVIYEITFDSEYAEHQFEGYEPSGITAVYDKEAQTITIDDHYKVELKPFRVPLIILENTTWAGYGTDSSLGAITPDYRLELCVYRLFPTEIYGELQIFCDEELEYNSYFNGYGFVDKDGSMWYEVYLNTPIAADNITETTPQAFWLRYDPTTEKFTASGICTNDIQMQKIFSEN